MSTELYVWCKEIVLGPLSNYKVHRIDVEAINYTADLFLKDENFPRTSAFTEEMKKFPKDIHIFFK